MTMDNKGRANQRKRTLNDLLQTAGRMLKKGKKFTMEDVAKDALVSRATTYLYFPSLEALLVEAPIHDIALKAGELFKDGSTLDPEERVDIAEAALHIMIYQNEMQLRVALMNSLKSWLDYKEHNIPVRQSRRIQFIETALAPVRDRLKVGDYEKLCAALCLFFGAGSMLVFREVYPLDKARMVKSWAIRTLVRLALEESKESSKHQ
jgi:AcrR family transcriptional regulator